MKRRVVVSIVGACAVTLVAVAATHRGGGAKVQAKPIVVTHALRGMSSAARAQARIATNAASRRSPPLPRSACPS